LINPKKLDLAKWRYVKLFLCNVRGEAQSLVE